MTARPFRFGISLLSTGPRPTWQARARQVEDLGYDVLQVPDHLGMPAPFPALVAAADVTTTLRLGTYVLNAGFYRPALLARDVADTQALTGGRLELGLGAGYVEAEFTAAGLPFPRAGARIDHLAATVTELKTQFASAEHAPPLLLAGDGDRVLRLAAREADIIGFSAMSAARPDADPEQVLADRVAFARTAAGERFPTLELNLFASTVSVGTDPDFTLVRQVAPGLSDARIRALPGVLVGSAHEIAEKLLRYRENHGITYLSVLEPALTEFAEVIKLLR
ncbi:TIGR03621 family F420-dependent LLM class oxidoreductase [Amycolatopsis rhabdoformis]|uniref:TIGR03621 family F420-dependent LLM class oxidoreductase n=1 Tax=Amycolatopsis rhabdoformis TaxID=1448059 RepID=A0ABZ1II31_9PSEU|nr:TIGR03621 family F420-dependent LLM class oxidoreductase [Amycolatopsis rhabdoformis]WSE34081.1 TIGR03621 family F420-dependent LLM class oxidoreductase [Amycolatopsis rhabdoformis]